MIEFIYKIFESIFIHRLKKSLDAYLEDKQPKEKVIKPVPLALINKESKKELTSTAKRLKRIVDLLFKNKYQNYSLNKVADTLELKNETEFYKLLNGETEPNFDFLNSFSEKYGVNKNWLKYGEDSPFIVGENQLYATGYLKTIKEIKPKSIFLIREESATGRTGIVLKLGNWNYKILGKSYHISSEVGGTGQIQIKEFYNFLKELNCSEFKYSIKSKILSQELYSKVFSGNISPSILEFNNYDDIKNSHWADDFSDFNHQYPIAENYEMRYGTEFIKAQNILKYKLQA